MCDTSAATALLLQELDARRHVLRHTVVDPGLRALQPEHRCRVHAAAVLQRQLVRGDRVFSYMRVLYPW